MCCAFALTALERHCARRVVRSGRAMHLEGTEREASLRENGWLGIGRGGADGRDFWAGDGMGRWQWAAPGFAVVDSAYARPPSSAPQCPPSPLLSTSALSPTLSAGDTTPNARRGAPYKHDSVSFVSAGPLQPRLLLPSRSRCFVSTARQGHQPRRDRARLHRRTLESCVHPHGGPRRNWARESLERGDVLPGRRYGRV